MHKIINKLLLKKRFAKSISTYNQNAVVQKQMATELLSLLTDSFGKDYNTVFEIGCGTGFLTELITKNANTQKLYINDIVPDALSHVRAFSQNMVAVQGDCETIEFPDSIDLIISNATFQWITDFDNFSEKLNSALKENGVLAFTTFGDKNFNQIKSITGKTLNYYNVGQIKEVLDKNFNVIHSSSKTIELEFDTAKDILNHLKLSGVNSLEKTSWTKKDLKHFTDSYDAQFKNVNKKLTLTYEPLFFIATKK